MGGCVCAAIHTCKGVVELFGQSARVVWPEGDGSWRHEQPIIRPAFLQRANASTELEAMNRGIPDLSVDGLIKLSSVIPFIAVAVVGDMAGANVRMKGFIESAFKDILYLLHIFQSFVIHKSIATNKHVSLGSGGLKATYKRKE